MSRETKTVSITPCPFCGATNTKVVIGSTYRWIKVQCVECDAASGEVRKAFTGGDITPEDRRAAYEAWNARYEI